MTTKISDIIVPEVFAPYIIERTVEISTLVLMGIVVPDPELDILAQRGGNLINMPFFTDLDGDDEILSDSGSLTPGGIGTGQDKAVLHMRGRAWGVNDLAMSLSGADPMGAIADLVAEYWNRREQDLIINTLTGVFADNIANDSSDLVSDISIEDGDNAADANKIGVDAVIDAKQKLGDAAGKLIALAIHSVVYSRLQKLNLIEFIPDARGEVNIPTYLGYRVIVNDNCPADAGSTSGYKYTSYLFGRGAIGRGEGNAPIPVETDRDSLAGEDYLIHRRHFLLHPRGVAWQASSVAGEAPTNAECAMAVNWNRVYERKNIRLVKLVTNG
ncbi:MAG: coat protein [Deltaproteobacteria bacterium]|nr:coat protein [Deltaproteobacteria bacterium]